ncbi:hypothetical protein I4U23_012096 [Adineta vaga]|nr:hypothetical protein I4U23_012096 [Adineta vaga]
MNERNVIEEQKYVMIKQDKQLSKTDNRLKLKFKSFKKSSHTSSNSSTVEKARTFFRVFDHKRHRDNEQLSSSPAICQSMITNDSSPPPPRPRMLINEDTSNQEFFLSPIARTTNISITKSMKVDKSNPRDMIVYRVAHNNQDDENLPLNYFQQKYRQCMKSSLLFPKQYFQNLLNKSNQTYATSFYKRGSHLRTSLPTFQSNSTRIYPPRYPNENLSPYRFSNLLYENPKCVDHPTESSFLVPTPSIQPVTQLILPSPYSTSTWKQRVERLNTEYRSTIEALQQAKEYLEETYCNSNHSSISKYASKVARDISNLSNNETKKSVNVTFCLPPSTLSQDSPPAKARKTIEKSKVPSPIAFSKPKLVKPIALNTFSYYESPEEKSESISSIIKKFNDLSNTIEKATEYSNSYKSDPSFLLTKFDSINKTDQIKNNIQEEETIYTIETLYQRANDRNSFTDDEPLIITREQTTAEQFESIHGKDHIQNSSSSESSYLTQSSSNPTPEIAPKKKPPKFISQIPRRITSTMHNSRLKSSPITFNEMDTTRSGTYICNKTEIDLFELELTPSIRKNYVKSVVRQLNTTASVSSTATSKRNSHRVLIKPTTFSNKNAI